MPLEPLRFLHAANLCLDRPLEGCGPIPDDVRPVAEDATLIALERIVEAAVERDVDFVLLGGNAFAARDRSLRARVALRDALETLDEHEVAVFVVPGAADPASAWNALPGLPANVTVLSNPTEEPIAIARDGRVVATLGYLAAESLDGDEEPRPHPTPRREPFAIGIVSRDMKGRLVARAPVDYVALIGKGPQQTIETALGIAHHPGPAQPLAAAATGPHGCTLVSVNADGRAHRTFLPVALVRRESLALSVDSQTTLDELAARMRGALLHVRGEASEQLWLVNWHLTGSGALFESLFDDRDPLLAQLGTTSPGGDGVRCLHSFDIDVLPEIAATSAHGQRLAREYFERLGSRQLAKETAVDSLLSEVHLPAATAKRMRSLLEQADAGRAAAAARRLGMTWFGVSTHEGDAPR